MANREESTIFLCVLLVFCCSLIEYWKTITNQCDFLMRKISRFQEKNTASIIKIPYKMVTYKFRLDTCILINRYE